MVTLYSQLHIIFVCDGFLQWAEKCHDMLFSWTEQSIEIKQPHSYLTGYNYIKKKYQLY